MKKVLVLSAVLWTRKKISDPDPRIRNFDSHIRILGAK
jgi:hypothetical protein